MEKIITNETENKETPMAEKQNTPNYQGILCDIAIDQHKTLKRMQTIMIIQSVIIAFLFIFIFVFAVSFGSRINTTLTEAEEAISNIKDLSTQLIDIIEKSKITDLLNNANDLINEGEDSMAKALSGVEDALKKIDEIDIDTLNKAIKDLESVVAPLAKLFGK